MYDYIPNKDEIIKKKKDKYFYLFKEANKITIKEIWKPISELVKSSREIENNVNSKHLYIKDYSWTNIHAWIKEFDCYLNLKIKRDILLVIRLYQRI